MYDWRNNLTALSQCYNLYFVACGSQLHVHRPTFPLQRLESVTLKWELPKSGANRPGYNDPRHPHGINQIAIGELGESEVLVCVCDDGDVIAYTTRSILDAIESKDSSPEPNEPEVSDAHIRPLLLRNVRRSAWGIAIHKNARLIAVSANTYRITVFPMGVSSATSDTEPEGNYWEKMLEPHDQKSGASIVLQGHHHNVPNLAFCNTSDDKEGRYLVSIAIDGTVIVWDVWQGKALQEIRTDRAMHANSVGWQVACIQKQWFRLVENEFAFLGASEVPLRSNCYRLNQSNCKIRNAGAWELSPKDYAPNSTSTQTPAATDDHEAGGADSETEYWDGEDELDEEEEDWYDNTDTDVDMDFLLETSGITDEDLLALGTPSPHQTLPALPALPGGPPAGSLNPPGLHISSAPVHPALPYNAPGAAILHEAHQALAANLDQELAVLPPTPPSQTSALRRLTRLHECADFARLGNVQLPFHLLVGGRDNVALHAPPTLDQPVTAFERACHQDTPWLALSPGALSPHHQRLNMLHVLPELGVAVVVTQMGRVAVFTLTRLVRWSDGRGAGRRGGPPPPRALQDRCGFRLDWLLPFEAQEKANERPLAPLLGIAVAPVQSWDMADGGAQWERPDGVPRTKARKWRLLLTYQDLTVLSYELSRGGGKEWDGDELLLI